MKDDTVYLRHISDAIARIQEYTKGLTYEGFIGNKMAHDAVIRQLEIIGEATKNLSSEIRIKYPDIPWKDIAGMRDKLTHDYFGVDLNAVWDTVEQDIPALKNKIEEILT